MDEPSKLDVQIFLSEQLNQSSFYEGHELQTTAFPIRVMKLLGVKILIGQLAKALHESLLIGCQLPTPLEA